MLKKLRLQFILWHMSINILLVLGCFFVVYFSTYAIIKNRNNEKLNLINTDYPRVFVSEKKNFLLRDEYAPFFFITLNEKNTMINTQSSTPIPSQLFNDAINLYLKKGENKGALDLFGKNWSYTTTVSIKLSGDITEENRRIIF